MTTDEILGKLWGMVEAWGPWLLGIYAVFFLVVLTLVAGVFVTVFRGFREHDRRRDAMRRGRRIP